MSTLRRTILATHLVFTGYAHWLSNDPRGSGSEHIRKEELKDLGEILPGRQYPQPPRSELREFYHQADERLEHERKWFTEDARNVIAHAFGKASQKFGYTIWEYAGCANHSHAVVRAHRDRAETIWSNLARDSMLALRHSGLFPDNHPVWATRPYKVFLFIPQDVVRRIDYVRKNPMKEGLPRQHWGFEKACPFEEG